jgi:hypothetical protein
MQYQQLFTKVLIAVCTVTSGSFVYGQEGLKLPDFSATQSFESRKASMSMRVYHSGSSVRVERSAALSTLYVPSESKVYNLTTYPDQSHQCVVMKPEQAKMLPSPLELLQGRNIERTSAGAENLDGHPCNIENVVVTRADGSTITSRVWEAQDLKGVPIRIDSRIGEITLSATYRDISFDPSEKDLFSLPETCTPLEKMGQVVEQATLR